MNSNLNSDLKFKYTNQLPGFWGFGVLGYLRTLSLKFQKATSKIEVFLSQENFNLGLSLLKF